MNRALKQITVSGLTLLLLGGIVSPSAARADTTDLPAVAKTATAAETTGDTDVQVSGLEMPYTALQDQTGKQTKIYSYPKLPSVVTATQLSDADYVTWFKDQYPSNETLKNLATVGGSAVKELSGKYDLSVPFIDFMVKSAGGALTVQSVEAQAGGQMAAFAWIIGDGTKFNKHELTQADIKSDFEKNVQPFLEKSPELARMLAEYQRDINLDSESFEAQFSPMVDQTAEMLFGKDYPEDQLANLDSRASYDATIAAYRQPLSHFVKKQADGTYVLDPALSGISGVSVFAEAPETHTTEPTPTPETSQPVTVHYVDAQGNQIAKDKTLTGKLGATYQTAALDIAGYQLNQTPANATGKFTSSKQSVTYTYDAVVQSGSAGATIAPKGTVIYATQKIGLYKQATFTKKARKQWYHKKSRMNRPMFVVTGYAKSKNGVKRYQVRDVNHHSRTAGKTGYVTANAKYTVPVYYATKHSRITVINPQGINGYSKKTLTGKRTHYRQGQVLKVKKIVTHNLTTRFVLSNGRYVTANKQLVKAGKQTMPKKIVVKHAIKRYGTANLTKRNRNYPAGVVLKVKGWTYSNAHNFGKNDTLPYRVSGGYVTANQHFVRTIK
ncbi:DUF5776 domain-containing protein [Levilactobacillus tongjiangensis]|uniref:DUF5776 domain-containing protein n=1 Tax=Levilactobacillus tongjiangensis TaxID=2486023 RepID=A0ABW1SSX6_9LACO|nr:DUF5776 domain-containing protein [Levilactobacillus tongjiangensis]